MSTMHFSWSDSLQAAFSSCLPCLNPSSDAPSDTEDQQRPRHPAFAHAIPPPRARPDELEGLLADASDDADALSLHTNPGERRTRKKRRRPPKDIRVFGYHLFGRPPAIQLPDSDHEDGGEGASGVRAGRGRSGSGSGSGGAGGQRTRKISTSTLDSDAAPLDAADIEGLSAARHAEALAREEEERRAKEERKRRRRERKELKRAAMAHALDLQANGDPDFEGFQGSGPVYGHGAPFSPSLGSGTGSGSMSITSSQDFGPFAQGQTVQPFDPDAADEAVEAEADGADFGGESYTSRPRKGKSSAGGSGTMTTSDTRSSSSRGTGSNGYTFVHPSAGLSGPASYNHQFVAQQQQRQQQYTATPMPHSPLSPLSQDSEAFPPSPLIPGGVTERKKRRKSKHKATSLSVSTSSQSATATASSLTSPPPSAHAPVPQIVSPSGGAPADDFEGFPGDFGSQELRAGAEGAAAVDVNALEKAERKTGEYLPVTGFPSVGFRRTDSRNSDMGVFLARRGDE